MRLLLPLLVIPNLAAQFVSPAWRKDGESEHASWDFFTKATYQWNSPDLVVDAPTKDAAIVCTTPGSILVGTGNIYNFNAPVALELRDSASFPIRSVLFQVQTLGSELDLADVRLVPPGATSTNDHLSPDIAFLINQEALTGERGGLGTSYVMQWNLTDAPLHGTYSILFRGAQSSTSLDKAQLDTSSIFTAIEEPTLHIAPPAIALQEGKITLTWPDDESLYLQSTTTLSDENSWRAVTDQPTTNNGQRSLTIALRNTPTFYRLSK